MKNIVARNDEIIDIESDTEEVINDLFLRETFVMSVNTRNIGLE